MINLWRDDDDDDKLFIQKRLADCCSLPEALHLAVTGVITFFSNLAKRQELLKKRVEEFEVNYNGEVEDCEKDFEDACEKNENRMNELHGEINDAAHHETLDTLKQQTFDHLDQMAVGYRDHADQLLGIHNRYPGDAQALIRRETRGYCQDRTLQSLQTFQIIFKSMKIRQQFLVMGAQYAIVRMMNLAI